MQFADLIKEKELVLVKFGADWCAPCKRIQPILEEIAGDWENEGLELWQVDVMNDPLSAEIMRVRSIPTLILFIKGKEVARLNGYNTKKEINDMLQANITG